MLKFGSFAVGRKGEPAAALGKRLEYFARPAKGFDRSDRWIKIKNRRHHAFSRVRDQFLAEQRTRFLLDAKLFPIKPHSISSR